MDSKKISEKEKKMENPEMLVALGFMLVSSVAVVHQGSIRCLKDAQCKKKHQVLSMAEAATTPLVGSVVLFLLYVALKLVPKMYLLAVLSLYLSVVSVFALGSFWKPLIGANVVVGMSCIGVGAIYFWTKNWVLNNVLAVSIGVVAIEQLHLGFRSAAILLVGLFFYDIFWVFGTDVMVSVATGIDGPIKIVFPQNFFSSDHSKKSLLGLGDIVIPGFYIAQSLCFSVLGGHGRNRGRFYFHVALVAYVASLVNTFLVMLVFKHAQPALLYIVPWLLISTFAAAAIKGDVGALLSYSAAVEEPVSNTVDETNKKEEEGDLSSLVVDAFRELFGCLPEGDLSSKKKN